MSDPRKLPDWKQKRHDERLILLLGAILDALLNPPSTTLTRTRKPNA
jgi:hypothetical protein